MLAERRCLRPGDGMIVRHIEAEDQDGGRAGVAAALAILGTAALMVVRAVVC